jgi:DDE family transposase
MSPPTPTNSERGVVKEEKDAIVYLGTSLDNQARSSVRSIQFWLHGRHYCYLTNVLDPHVLKLSDVVGLYARRWDIELAFRAIKDHLNLHHLWSAKWAVVQVQLWCCLILAQVYHALYRWRLPGKQA